jgi:acyl-CoA synthetase (AMP-forming)/AMP-acid ligase II
MDIDQILILVVHKYPSRTAILFEETRFTNQEFNGRVNQLTHSLLPMELKKAEKVAALLFNSNHKDMIVRGGENIYPRESEEVLYHHSKIQEASVIGVPDKV